ncbi:histidine phosphatase family protein [Sphaerotilus sp.]|uniref:histidine phosphatase family protein n=1 Tax=Sphaerotilus sp. TaxID=2093942 RepID=UPI00286E9B41|nr:histidine phosphatase family protein [Sphaerotilus sp.]
MTQTPTPRRRLYLMRHGSVDYFLDDGTPVPPETVPLNATGRAQADSAGALFAASNVRFDRVLVSGLPRTVETAQRVLAAAGSDTAIETDTALQEIRPGRLSDLPKDAVRAAFLGAFESDGTLDATEGHRFLGGESVGELLDRCLPAWARFLGRSDWDTALVVLHGGVNRALLSSALAGTRAFFGRMEQAPACINVLDIGHDHAIIRAMNLSPTQWLNDRERQTTMEKLLAQYLRTESNPA